MKEAIIDNESKRDMHGGPLDTRLAKLSFETEVKLLKELENFKATHNGKTWNCCPKIYGSGYCKKKIMGQVEVTVGFIILEYMQKPEKVTNANLVSNSSGQCNILQQTWAAFIQLLKAGYIHVDSHEGNYMLRNGMPVIVDWGWGWKKSWGVGTQENWYAANELNYNHVTPEQMIDWQYENMDWVWNNLSDYCGRRFSKLREEYEEAKFK